MSLRVRTRTAPFGSIRPGELKAHSFTTDGLPATMRAPMAELPTGTVTIVVAEGRRMMRLAGELGPDLFGALLDEYQRLLRHLLESMGGREVDFDGDTATAVFPTAKQAALAAVAASTPLQRMNGRTDASSR